MNPSCTVHKNIDDLELQEVRRSVCGGENHTFPSDGRSYCLLHYPSQEKDHDEFGNIVGLRIGDLRKAFIEANPKSSTLGTLDLRFVWFPDEYYFFSDHIFFSIELKGATFSTGLRCDKATFHADIDLSHCVFHKTVSFKNSTFKDSLYFSQAVCHGIVDFDEATFDGAALFYSCIFKEIVYFNFANFYGSGRFDGSKFEKKVWFDSAKFLLRLREGDKKSDYAATFNEVEFKDESSFQDIGFEISAEFDRARFQTDSFFRKARFSGKTSFKRAIFEKDVYFTETIFSENTEVSFYHARFEKDGYFHSTQFLGGASFNSSVFGSNSDVIFRQGCMKKIISFRYASVEGLLRITEVDNEDCELMKFQEISTEKATRVSFNGVKLRPSWFAISDPRKFVFTNIDWGSESKVSQFLSDELTSVCAHNDIKRTFAYELLITAFRQLAVNAEEANRLELASKFRRLAFECERVKRKNKQQEWRSSLTNSLAEGVECGNFFSHVGQFLREIWNTLVKAPFDPVHAIYRQVSLFGENWVRAAIVLMLLWFGFGVVYYVLRDLISLDWTFANALGFSTSTMLLQKLDLPNTSNIIFSLRTIQMLASPIQAAVLALAIRRKFMR